MDALDLRGMFRMLHDMSCQARAGTPGIVAIKGQRPASHSIDPAARIK